jgi:hypothetical protein
MTVYAAAPGTPTSAPTPIAIVDEYRPGVCNIGPAEIARRRRAGHVGAIAAAALFAGLVAIDAPPLLRLAIALPAAVSASGYLQARLKFCAGFGQMGVFNFDDLGTTQQVVDEAARAADRRMARRISLTSGAIGLAVGVAAALLPI